jgi:hypothetical protein
MVAADLVMLGCSSSNRACRCGTDRQEYGAPRHGQALPPMTVARLKPRRGGGAVFLPNRETSDAAFVNSAVVAV